MRECKSEGVELAPEEVQRLNDLPDAANNVGSHLLCELEDGHTGAHWALAQTQDRGEDTTNWWLRWTSDSREWSHNEDCPVENPDASELCLLPADHEGAHGWS